MGLGPSNLQAQSEYAGNRSYWNFSPTWLLDSGVRRGKELTRRPLSSQQTLRAAAFAEEADTVQTSLVFSVYYRL